MEMKRKSTGEEPRDWDDVGNYNAGSPKAPTVPLCINVKPPLSIDTMTQPVSEDVASKSSETLKRSRIEAHGKGQMNPVRPGPFADENLRRGNVESAANTRPLLREHRGPPFVIGPVPKRPREIIDVPIARVCRCLTTGALPSFLSDREARTTAGGRTQEWQAEVTRQENIQNQTTRQSVTANDEEEHRNDFASAGGALDFGVKLRFDDPSDASVMSLNMTEGFVRAVRQTNLKVESKENGPCLLLTWNGNRHCA